jgi:hypothetical protein
VKDGEELSCGIGAMAGYKPAKALVKVLRRNNKIVEVLSYGC